VARLSPPDVIAKRALAQQIVWRRLRSCLDVYLLESHAPQPPSTRTMDVDDPSTSRSPPADIPLAPAPWVLKTKLYLFATVLKPVHPEDPILQGLPPGSYNPSETIHPSALAPVNGAPQWKGGLTSVVIVRYEESPVGPYDELIMTSDGFANPYEKGTSGRITNIYVSTRDSVWNGRKNWSM
jgi:hypothetical protein